MKLYQFFKNAKRTRAFYNPLLLFNVLVLSYFQFTMKPNTATETGTATMEAHQIIGNSCFPVTENELAISLQLPL